MYFIYFLSNTDVVSSDVGHVKLVFLLGHPVTPVLQSESFVHGDIVQSSVRDHYTTLHYKTLSGFVWVNRSVKRINICKAPSQSKDSNVLLHANSKFQQNHPESVIVLAELSILKKHPKLLSTCLQIRISLFPKISF